MFLIKKSSKKRRTIKNAALLGMFEFTLGSCVRIKDRTRDT